MVASSVPAFVVFDVFTAMVIFLIFDGNVGAASVSERLGIDASSPPVQEIPDTPDIAAEISKRQNGRRIVRRAFRDEADRLDSIDITLVSVAHAERALRHRGL